ncbi:Porphobilinogen deaminase [Streptomyces tendae]
MTEKALRLGTRRSKLAMAQSGQVADAVSQVTGRPVELVEITTYGDTSREHLAQIGGTGVFVAALRDALLRGEVDFAVHSLKDLPTAQHEGLVVAAIPEREDPRDVVVARDACKPDTPLTVTIARDDDAAADLDGDAGHGRADAEAGEGAAVPRTAAAR